MEIRRIRKEEIEPKVSKLQKEKQDYLKNAAFEQEKEGLHRLVISHDYTLAQDELDQGAGLRGEIEGELEENTATHTSLRGELDEMTAATEGMMKEKASREGGELKEITLQEASASKVLVELNSKFTNKDASVKEEEAAIAGLQKQEVRKTREEKKKGEREREREMNLILLHPIQMYTPIAV